MNGKGVIVFRMDNQHHDFYEHSTIPLATMEAHRLCREIGGKFVIYVPVAIVEGQPVPVIHETSVRIPGVDVDDELPF